jgi:O-antigen/teichoic acid export membrane protein
MSSLIQNLKRSKYLKSILTLFSGTALSLLIPICSSFILDDLYTPAAFGIYTVFTGILVLFTSVAEGKYSLAITLPKEEKEAKDLFYLGVGITLSLFIVGVCLLAIYGLLAVGFNLVFYDWWLLLPICVLLVGINESQNYWLIRQGNFGVLAKIKVKQAVVLVVFQLLLGYLHWGYWGLLIAQFLGYLSNFINMNKAVQQSAHLSLFEAKANRSSILALSKRYINFPKYTLPSEFINVLINQMPAFFLGFFFGQFATGIYGLTHRILSLPISVLSKAVLDVFKEKASREFREHGNCKNTYQKTALLLFSMGVIPFGILGFFAPQLFDLVFNEQWKQAGYYAQILTPMYFLGFVISPLTYTFTIAEKQKNDFVYHLYVLVSMALAFGLSYYWFKKIEITLVCFVGNYCLIYLFYLVKSYQFSKGNEIP